MVGLSIKRGQNGRVQNTELLDRSRLKLYYTGRNHSKASFFPRLMMKLSTKLKCTPGVTMVMIPITPILIFFDVLI